MAGHVHNQKFDGDDPYLVCSCGKMWDALTGKEIVKQVPTLQSKVNRIKGLLDHYATFPTSVNKLYMIKLINDLGVEK